MALPAGAKIVDPFAEKEGGMNLGSLAKTVLAGLGVHSAIDFFVRNLLIRLRSKIKEIKTN